MQHTKKKFQKFSQSFFKYWDLEALLAKGDSKPNSIKHSSQLVGIAVIGDEVKNLLIFFSVFFSHFFLTKFFCSCG
jgi:hypothetical protein